ncbi:MAG: phosphotransferase [Lachnospiraceae bacterium]|nr:phosphotransferase [Lachnospiraceae bacterium]
MLILDKINMIPYLKVHMPQFDFSGPISITEIGDGSQSAEDAGDGYVNYIFIVSLSDDVSFVVKQSRETARMSGGLMTTARNRLEYDAMRIFHAIAPDYVPDIYFIDDENRVFAMEDASRDGRKIVRFQMNQNRLFPLLGIQCGNFLADTAFYTSEYYLETADFRQLSARFLNEDMRPIMETGLFLNLFDAGYDITVGEEFLPFVSSLTEDPAFVTERYKLRHIYMTSGECLIHADLHTSNLFASEDSMKAIDMEFTFCGPFSYDIGYFWGNLISQYAAATFRDFPSEKERKEFKAYLLTCICEMYHTYINRFIDNWDQDAKDIYKGLSGLQNDFAQTILKDAPGFAAVVNWFRVAGMISYPDFDMITDLQVKRKAYTLSLLIDWQIIFHRYSYTNIQDFIDDILFAEERFTGKRIDFK